LVKATGHLELWWCPAFHWRSQWIEDTRDPHVNKDSTPITAFLLIFIEEVIQLLVAVTDKYYSQYLDTLQ
jgi:hypothetical protein